MHFNQEEKEALSKTRKSISRKERDGGELDGEAIQKKKHTKKRRKKYEEEISNISNRRSNGS